MRARALVLVIAAASGCGGAKPPASPPPPAAVSTPEPPPLAPAPPTLGPHDGRLGIVAPQVVKSGLAVPEDWIREAPELSKILASLVSCQLEERWFHDGKALIHEYESWFHNDGEYDDLVETLRRAVPDGVTVNNEDQQITLRVRHPAGPLPVEPFVRSIDEEVAAKVLGFHAEVGRAPQELYFSVDNRAELFFIVGYPAEGEPSFHDRFGSTDVAGFELHAQRSVGLGDEPGDNVVGRRPGNVEVDPLQDSRCDDFPEADDF